MRRLLYVIGTRPNFVKMAPVIAALRQRLPDAEHTIVHTGQHYDRMMSEIFLEQLGVPDPDHMLGVGSGTHAEMTAAVIERMGPVLAEHRPELVLVPGDVNSTLAAALAAADAGIPIAHVESGLRSFDPEMPEEANRILTDHLSELLFLHSEEAITNLAAEGVGEERMHFVGNTMIDSLVALEDQIRSRGAAAELGIDPGSYLLVTLHRPALVDGPLLADAMRELAAVAGEGDGMPVIFPVHPRTRARIAEEGIESGSVRLIDPVGYLDFLSLQADARAVLTDSGGIQEETSYLGVRCFTLRDNTERPVTVRVGTNTLLGLDPARIGELPGLLDGDGAPQGEAGAIGAGGADTASGAGGAAAGAIPKWDGKAAERIADVVASFTGFSNAGLGDQES